jgi:single-strand DNA-binding protein
VNTAVNHCLLEVEVLEAPQVRYTQDNQTPVAEMAVQFDGLRPDDPPGQLKVVGWGSLAQDLQNRVQVGQRLMVEGRLRMNTVTRQDGVKEKRAEFTLSRLHPLAGAGAPAVGAQAPMASRAPAPAPARAAAAPAAAATAAAPQPPAWNASPLVPDLPEGEDEIPF